ncbi:MAG: hypothetical protein WB543_06180 [Candidatus Acidiferrum sp.]
MTKQTKWALGVLAFVVTATVARRVGQFEMKGQAEQQIALLQQRITKLQEENELRREDYGKLVKSIPDPGEDILSKMKGFADGVHEYQACKRGDRAFCEHIMLLVSETSNKRFDVLYNEQGNYKKNAFELFERIEAQQAQDGGKQ